MAEAEWKTGGWGGGCPAEATLLTPSAKTSNFLRNLHCFPGKKKREGKHPLPLPHEVGWKNWGEMQDGGTGIFTPWGVRIAEAIVHANLEKFQKEVMLASPVLPGKKSPA